MSYLLDSEWVADYLKGRAPATEVVDSLFPAGLAISIITFAEVYEGIYYGRDRAHYEQAYRDFLQGADVLGISRAAARRFAVIRGALRVQGQLISQTDLLIATTALEHDLVMVTRNLRDFERVPELRLYGRS